VFGVADAGDDGGGGAGEVVFDEAEADAWVLLSRAVRGAEARLRDALPLLAPVMRKLVGLPPGILTDLFLRSLEKSR
jgi:hypothetical protein